MIYEIEIPELGPREYDTSKVGWELLFFFDQREYLIRLYKKRASKKGSRDILFDIEFYRYMLDGPDAQKKVDKYKECSEKLDSTDKKVIALLLGWEITPPDKIMGE